MINLIWVIIMGVGIIYAGMHGKIDQVTLSAINAADNAVQLSLKLVGVMCLWLGMMRIAEKAGLARGIAIVLGPLLQLLFPSVPRHHPAMGAIIMTVSANMLGLGNAVTPLGIKAMQELNKLNKDKYTASAAMCTLVALCTTGFTVVPATIIALRAAAGSTEPSAIAGPTLIVSFIGTVVVVVVDRFCRAVFGSESRRF